MWCNDFCRFCLTFSGAAFNPLAQGADSNLDQQCCLSRALRINARARESAPSGPVTLTLTHSAWSV